MSARKEAGLLVTGARAGQARSTGTTAEEIAAFDRAVDDRLAEVVRQASATATGESARELWRTIADSLRGGKRTRPRLVRLGYRAFGGRDDAAILDLGCAFELLHTGLMMHDDVIDHDFVRRGHPTLSAHYRDRAAARGVAREEAEHTGNSVAIIAGDALIAESLRLVFRFCGADATRADIFEVFHLAIRASAAGELDDVLFSVGVGSPDLASVMHMHRMKTAAYSFEAPLQIGALAAGASPAAAAELASAGASLGRGYQIIDDVLGTFGESATVGKPTDSDLRERKSTVLIALAESDPELVGVVEQWRAGSLDAQAMRTRLISFGAETRARSLAEQCWDEARSLLAALQMTDETHSDFEGLILALQKRTA